MDEVPSNEAYEHSEMLLYKAQLLQEAGKHAEAVAVIQEHKVYVHGEQI